MTKAVWNESILKEGGVSYWFIQDKSKEHLKDKYRVSMNLGGSEKMFKWKCRTALGVFSVSAKTMSEAQSVVDEVFGKGHYKVSQMLVG